MILKVKYKVVLRVLLVIEKSFMEFGICWGGEKEVV